MMKSLRPKFLDRISRRQLVTSASGLFLGAASIGSLNVVAPMIGHQEAAAEGPAKRESIRLFLDLSGFMVTTKIRFMRSSEIEDSALTSLREQLWAQFVEDTIDSYEKIMSEKSVQQQIAFYQSQSGIEFARVQLAMERPTTDSWIKRMYQFIAVKQKTQPFTKG